MSFNYDISKKLSDEHQKVIILLDQLSNFLKSSGAVCKPDLADTTARKMMSDLKAALEVEVPNHFGIEEREVFPLMDENGMSSMVEILLQDHKIILELAAKIMPIISKIVSDPKSVSQSEWESFVRYGSAFANELTMHAQKEEHGLVPAIDEILKSDDAIRIMKAYKAMSS